MWRKNIPFAKVSLKMEHKPSAERLAQKWAELINAGKGEVRPAHVPE